MYINLLKLARILGVDITQATTLAQVLTAIKSKLNALTATAKGASKKNKIFTTITSGGCAAFVMADGTEEEFNEGDSIAAWFAQYDDVPAFAEALVDDLGNSPFNQDEDQDADTFGLDSNGDIANGYGDFTTKSGSTIYKMATYAQFQASKKKFWNKLKMRVDSISAREAVSGANYLMVDFRGVLFTDEEPSGLDITIQFNTNYLKKAVSIFTGAGITVTDGVPQLGKGKSLWINVETSEEEAGVSILESQDGDWVAETESRDGTVRETRSGNQYCYVVSRSTSNQHSGRRVLGIVSNDDVKTIKDMIAYRGTKTVDVEFAGKMKASNLEFLAANSDAVLELKGKGYSIAEILMFLK